MVHHQLENVVALQLEERALVCLQQTFVQNTLDLGKHLLLRLVVLEPVLHQHLRVFFDQTLHRSLRGQTH